MNQLTGSTAPGGVKKHKWSLLGLGCGLIVALLWPYKLIATLVFVLEGMLAVSYLVIPGILVSAWVNASGAGGRIRQAFAGNQTRAIIVASLIGAITPVCGVTVLPLMAGLLAAGVPLAPVMAFWLSSPVTGPAMFSVTVATLGLQFAIAKIVAAFLFGVFGGMSTAAVSRQHWIQSPLRESGFAATLGQQAHCGGVDDIKYAFWKDPERIRQFNGELWAMTKLIVICLGLAFAAEYQMQVQMQPEAWRSMSVNNPDGRYRWR